MRVEIETVNLEVYPVEHERLDEAEDCFAEESIDAKFHVALVQQAEHATAEDQGHKRIRPLDPMFDIRPREELQPLLDLLRDMFRHPLVRPLDEDHEYVAEQVEDNGRPNKSLSRRLLDMNTPDPQRHRDKRNDPVPNHTAPHHRNRVRIPEQTHRHEQSRREIEAHEWCVSMLKGTRHVGCEAQQTRQYEKNRHAPQHIVGIKPRDQQPDIRPKLPAHDKRNHKPQQRLPRRMLRRRIARQRNNPHIKQIDKQLVARDFLRLSRPPQQALVEVLPHYRPLVHVHEGPQLALRVPHVLVEAGGPGCRGRVGRVVRAQVRRIAVFGEVCVELDGVLGNHVDFGAQGVEVADDALEFRGEGGVLFVELLVARRVVLVGVAEGFELCWG